MTVQELISELQKLPDHTKDKKIFIHYPGGRRESATVFDVNLDTDHDLVGLVLSDLSEEDEKLLAWMKQ